MNDDDRRQIQKALDVMYWVQKHFDGEAAMNAALHMSDIIRPAPLAAAVSMAVLDLERLMEANAPERPAWAEPQSKLPVEGGRA